MSTSSARYRQLVVAPRPRLVFFQTNNHTDGCRSLTAYFDRGSMLVLQVRCRKDGGQPALIQTQHHEKLVAALFARICKSPIRHCERGGRRLLVRLGLRPGMACVRASQSGLDDYRRFATCILLFFFLPLSFLPPTSRVGNLAG